MVLSICTLDADRTTIAQRFGADDARETHPPRTRQAHQHRPLDTAQSPKPVALNEMTMHEIADATGLRNSGRVSEILNRKR